MKQIEEQHSRDTATQKSEPRLLLLARGLERLGELRKAEDPGAAAQKAATVGMQFYRAARDAERGDPLQAAVAHEAAAKHWDTVGPLYDAAAEADANGSHFSAGRSVSRYRESANDARQRAAQHRKQAQTMREIHGLDSGTMNPRQLSTYQKSEPRVVALARGLEGLLALRKGGEERCEECGSSTHAKDACPHLNRKAINKFKRRDQKPPRCSECASPGHTKSSCPHLKKAWQPNPSTGAK